MLAKANSLEFLLSPIYVCAASNGSIFMSSVLSLCFYSFLTWTMATATPYYVRNGPLKKIWSNFWGKRAGKLFKSREAFRCYKINTVEPRQITSLEIFNDSLTCQGLTTQQTAFTSLHLVCHDQRTVQERLSYPESCFPTWCPWRQKSMNSAITRIISINGFTLAQLHWQTSVHGGVCTYINDSIQFSLLDDLADPTFEVLWLEIRPTRLPRGISRIDVPVYHPPSAEKSAMLNYLMNCLSSIESQRPNSGILLFGDFNQLQVGNLKSSFNLKQLSTSQLEAKTPWTWFSLTSTTSTRPPASVHLLACLTTRLSNSNQRHVRNSRSRGSRVNQRSAATKSPGSPVIPETSRAVNDRCSLK